jgi:DNA polymerase-3 subunit alpha
MVGAYRGFFSHHISQEREHPIIGKGGQVCGMIKSVRTRLDKRENTIAFLEFEDFTAQGEIVIWSDTYKLYSHLLMEDSVVLVRGKIEIQNDQMKVTADEIIPMSETVPKYAKGYTIQIELTETSEDIMKSLAALAKGSAKQSSLSFLFKDKGAIVSRFTSASANLELSQTMYEKLVALFGKKNVTFEVF